MSKFNTQSVGSKTINAAGGEAYQETPQLEFVSLLLTSFVQDQFYRKESDVITRVKGLLGALDKKFAAKAAIYARNEFGMRSISHVVAGEIAGTVHGTDWGKSFFDKVIRRPDDMTEILAYYYANYGKTEPNALKKGFASALQRFDAYQLAKYRKEGQAVSLVDVVNIAHPKPTDAITLLVQDKLRNVDTFEAKLSEAGKVDAEDVDEAKNAAWRDLILERKIGYFALLRNLRNIVEQTPDVLPIALELLTDQKLIKKSLVLPFRYLTALQEIRQLNGPGVQNVLMAINKAVDIATSNVPKFDGKTLVVLDESGSMVGSSYGNHVDFTAPATIGALFAAILAKANGADLMTFSDSARYQTINPMDSTLTIAGAINFRPGGTNFHSIFETANQAYDRVIILSDMQGWVGYYTPQAEFAAYKKRVGASPKIFSFDLTGQGSLQFPENNVYAIAGFSDKVFDLMAILDKDRNALVKTIEKIEI